MAAKKFYGEGLPGLDLDSLSGLLIVIEGADGSGRSVQSTLLRDWLGKLGYPTTEIGLKRSGLVASELGEAMQGNTLNPRTISLFYATDFIDQLENSLIPALRAGFIVIADRYIYTLMARDIVRGADRDWIQGVYGPAIVPDMRIFLKVRPQKLAERSFQKSGALNYWESGMDIVRSGDMYECFVRYQSKVGLEFNRLCKQYDFDVLDGNRDIALIQRDIQQRVTSLLQRWKAGGFPSLEPSVISGKTRGLDGRFDALGESSSRSGSKAIKSKSKVVAKNKKLKNKKRISGGQVRIHVVAKKSVKKKK